MSNVIHFKLIKNKINIVFCLALMFIINACNNPAIEEKANCGDFDTTKYKKIYNKDGYLLLAAKVTDDNGYAKMLTTQKDPINIDTAARVVGQYLNKRSGIKYPIVIDFDYTTINNVLAELNLEAEGQEDKKSIRIYFAKYDKKALQMMYPNVHDTIRNKLENYMTAVLVGRFNGLETTNTYNLGDLCPPNCVPVGTTTPDASMSKVYKKAKDRL